MKKTLDMYIKKALYSDMIEWKYMTILGFQSFLKIMKKTLDMYSKKALYLGINNG